MTNKNLNTLAGTSADNTLASKKYVDSKVGSGLPSGGDAGDVLIKASNNDGDVKWDDVETAIEMNTGYIITTDPYPEKPYPDVDAIGYNIPMTQPDEGWWTGTRTLNLGLASGFTHSSRITTNANKIVIDNTDGKYQTVNIQARFALTYMGGNGRYEQTICMFRIDSNPETRWGTSDIHNRLEGANGFNTDRNFIFKLDKRVVTVSTEFTHNIWDIQDASHPYRSVNPSLISTSSDSTIEPTFIVTLG